MFLSLVLQSKWGEGSSFCIPWPVAMLKSTSVIPSLEELKWKVNIIMLEPCRVSSFRLLVFC